MDLTAARDGNDGSDAAGFPRPPVRFVDDADREIDVRTADEADSGPLVEMYDALHADDRAQGVPPLGRDRIESWLADLLADGYNVAAWHGDRAVGHACLLPAGEGRHELAIFVASDYQHAGIGTGVLHTLLGYGQEVGVQRAWLLVRRPNVVARRLYESAGFGRVDDPEDPLGPDIEMVRDL